MVEKNITGAKLARYVIWVAIAAVIAVIAWYFSSIVFYILISAVLAIIGKPVVGLLCRLNIKGRHLPRWFAALATVISIWTIIVLTLYFFIPVVIDKVKEFTTIDIEHVIVMFQQPLDNLQQLLQRLFGFDGNSFSIADALVERASGVLNLKTIDNAVTSVLGFAIDTVIAIFSITFMTFFMLKENNLLYSMMMALFPARHETNVIHALDSISVLLRRYFTGIIAESTIITILDSVILMSLGLGVQTALFIGFMMGVLNVIPYMGPVIGACICMVTGVLYPIPGWSAEQMALMVGCVVIAVNLIDNFVLQPVLYSKSVKAHPLEIFVVILMAGSLGGVLGMLLAIPAYNVIRVLLKEFFGSSHFVQRLTRNI